MTAFTSRGGGRMKGEIGKLLCGPWFVLLSACIVAPGEKEVPTEPDGGVDAGGEVDPLTLVPGNPVSATLTPGDADTYLFDAAVGQTAIVRAIDVAGGELEPRLTAYRPDGSIEDVRRGEEIAGIWFSTTQAGIYRVVIDNGAPNQGSVVPYQVQFVLAPGAGVAHALPAGGAVDGYLTKGALGAYTFSATVGQGIHLRAVDLDDTALDIALALYRPDGSEVGHHSASSVAGYRFSAPVAGIYTVVIYDASWTRLQTGRYRVYCTIAPGADTGGALSSGGVVQGTLEKGELESFTFTAAVGQGVTLRAVDVVDGSMVPKLAVYRPDGTLQGEDDGASVAGYGFSAPVAGTYTVAVYDASFYADASGAFRLYFTRAPGANAGGALSPGGVVAGVLDKGELESFTFTAAVGQGVILRVADVVDGAMVPELVVYRPDGSLQGWDDGAAVASYGFAAPQAGTYTVLVYDASFYMDATGAFHLHYMLAPGANAGGVLSPGGVVAGVLEKGELESFTFAAGIGQRVILRVADVAGGAMDPELAVYRPDGSLQGWDNGSSVADYGFSAPQAGTYTVVVYDASFYMDATGTFRLYYVRAPGANAGGALSPGGVVAGVLEKGELESFTFAAAVGQGVILRVADIAGGAMVPELVVYRPDGSLQGWDNGSSVADYGFSAPQAGTYTVVVYDASFYMDVTGAFRLYYTLAPGANAGGTLSPGSVVAGVLDKGELESFTFTATAGQGMTVRVLDVSSTALTPAFTLYRPDGSVEATRSSASMASYAFSPSQSGTYTLVVYDSSLYIDEIGTFQVSATVP